jgi:hypothetical protein
VVEIASRAEPARAERARIRSALARPGIATAAALTATVGVAGSLLTVYTARIEVWRVMTDELLYVKLATSIGTTLSPLPVVHGEPVAILNQLYPLLLAPLFGALDVPTAFRAAHVLNAFVMASAAVPAYLLALQVVPRVWAHVVAVLTVAVPWMVLTGVLMTEVAAYPAFLWAVLALQRALVAPSAGRDLAALAGIVLAVLARTQFVALALVLPFAVLGHEAWSAGARGALRSAVGRHRVLAGAYAAGAVIAAGAATAGVLDRALGSYAAAAEGALLPEGVWRSAFVHLDLVGIGLGLVPLILGGAWLLESVVRPATRAGHALATLSLLAIGALALQTASYDLRFGGPGFVRDRYLFYVAPLLLVAAAAGLRERPRAVTLVALSAVFAWSVRSHEFEPVRGLSLDAPTTVLNDVLRDQSGGLATGSFVALVGLLLGIVLALTIRLVPVRALGAGLAVVLLGFSLSVTAAAVRRVLTSDPPTPRHLGAGGVVPDWIDGVLPEGASAAAVPFPVSTAWDISALLWWDVEFWNRSVGEVFVGADRRFNYGMPPSRTLALDFETGSVSGTADAPAFLVVAAGDPRFRLAGPRHATNLGLEVIAVERPYRAEWATRGLSVDGWTEPGGPVTIRVFAVPGQAAAPTQVKVHLTAPPAPAAYTLATAGTRRGGELAPGEARVEELEVCPPPGGHADIRLVSERAASIPGPPLGPGPAGTRSVGVGVGRIEVARDEGAC